MQKLNNKIAILIPGNGKYFASSKEANGKIHPFRRKIYEEITKLGYLCEYIGYGDLRSESLKRYSTLFLLNIERLDRLQRQVLKGYFENGGNLVLTYKTKLAKEFGISFKGKCHSKMISFKGERINYQIINVSSIIYKINHKYFKAIFPVNKFLKLPVIKVKTEDENEILATWPDRNLPALLLNKSYKGTVIYFSGVLAGAENSLLKHILSLIKVGDFKPIPFIPNGKRCCVTIFHDYEREYGSPKLGKYADKGLNSILELEKKYNIKSTFNIVGKICESQADSIKQIIRGGHEIAVHTYGHEVPANTSYKNLNDTVDLSLKIFKTEFNISPKGFRSPESKWNSNLIKILEKHNFLWDAEDENASLPYNLVLDRRLKLVRIPIICDDFPYIKENISPDDMLIRLKKIINKGVEERDFIAIGFHPWIEGMEDERLRIFKEFLSYLSSKDDTAIMTFGQVCSWWIDRK